MMLLLITFLRKEYALEQALFSRQKCFFLVRAPLLEPNFDLFSSWVQQAESHGVGGGGVSGPEIRPAFLCWSGPDSLLLGVKGQSIFLIHL